MNSMQTLNGHFRRKYRFGRISREKRRGVISYQHAYEFYLTERKGYFMEKKGGLKGKGKRAGKGNQRLRLRLETDYFWKGDEKEGFRNSWL